MTVALDVRRATIYPSVPVERAEFGWHVANAFTDRRFLEMVRDAGGKYVRVHPSWESVESGATGVRALPANIAKGLADCVELGLVPIVVAGIASPATILAGTQTLTASVPIGSYVLPMSSVAGIVVGDTHVQKFPNTKITATGKWGFIGSRIVAVDTGASTITLASKTTVALASGTRMYFQKYVYPAIVSKDPAQAGSQGYRNYVAWLIDELAGRCPGGALISLMNEPTWPNEPWSNAARMYDVVPSGIVADERMEALARACMTLRPPANVGLVNNAPDKTGVSSMALYSPLPTADEMSLGIAWSSQHPYGWNPETFSWDKAAGVDGGGYLTADEYSVTGNFRLDAYRQDLFATANGGVRQRIIETELGTGNPTGVGDAQTAQGHRARAKYSARRMLVSLGCGSIPVFYTLAIGSVYDMVDRTTYEAHDAYYTLQRIAGLIATVGGPATARWVPAVVGVPNRTVWPIMAVTVHGLDGAVFFVWQRTYNNPRGGVSWGLIPTPDPIAVQVIVPVGGSIAECVNVITGDAVMPTTSDDGIVSLPFTDEVVALRIAA